jgi:hypothetical protein
VLKNYFFAGILKVNDENSRIRIQDPNPDPLVRGMDPRIRIHPKMSWIRNTAPNSTPGPLLVSHGLKELHHDVRIHFELDLLLRVAHDFPTVLHDELNGGVAKAL